MVTPLRPVKGISKADVGASHWTCRVLAMQAIRLESPVLGRGIMSKMTFSSHCYIRAYCEKGSIFNAFVSAIRFVRIEISKNRLFCAVRREPRLQCDGGLVSMLGSRVSIFLPHVPYAPPFKVVYKVELWRILRDFARLRAPPRPFFALDHMGG